MKYRVFANYGNEQKANNKFRLNNLKKIIEKHGQPTEYPNQIFVGQIVESNNPLSSLVRSEGDIFHLIQIEG